MYHELILILKSLEDVIANVTEVLSGDLVKKYKLENPYTLALQQSESSTGSDVQTRVGFYPYAALSKNNVIEISLFILNNSQEIYSYSSENFNHFFSFSEFHYL